MPNSNLSGHSYQPDETEPALKEEGKPSLAGLPSSHVIASPALSGRGNLRKFRRDCFVATFLAMTNKGVSLATTDRNRLYIFSGADMPIRRRTLARTI